MELTRKSWKKNGEEKQKETQMMISVKQKKKTFVLSKSESVAPVLNTKLFVRFQIILDRNFHTVHPSKQQLARHCPETTSCSKY